jgi:hypothetical protein
LLLYLELRCDNEQNYLNKKFSPAVSCSQACDGFAERAAWFPCDRFDHAKLTDGAGIETASISGTVCLPPRAP